MIALGLFLMPLAYSLGRSVSDGGGPMTWRGLRSLIVAAAIVVPLMLFTPLAGWSGAFSVWVAYEMGDAIIQIEQGLSAAGMVS